MNEPVVCYVALILIGCWAAFSLRQKNQEWLMTMFSKLKCFCILRIVQWYNLTMVFLALALFRTLYDIIRFDFVASKFLSPDAVSQDHGFCVGVPQEFFDKNMVGIPSFLRWISLASPFAGLIAFILVIQNVRIFIKSKDGAPQIPYFSCSCSCSTPYFSWSMDEANPMPTDNGPGTQYMKWISKEKTTMVIVVVGMPLVFVVMALRATIRQWAVMTCSSWPNLHHQFPALAFGDVRTLEVATYTQDLAVASAFQFIAVFFFGLCCSHALKLKEQGKKVDGTPELIALRRDNEEMRRQLGLPAANEVVEHGAEGAGNDIKYLKQASILGIYAFTFLGVVKSIVSIAVAMCQDQPALEETISKVQVIMATKVDPCFLFATVLSVINMFLMGQIEDVKAVLGNVNMKFNATRALLLIGQGQLMLLTSVTTQNASYDKIMAFLHKVPHLENLSWQFNEDQARLFHSSLLCFECLLVAVANLRLWEKEFAMRQSWAEQVGAREALLGTDSKYELA